MNAPKTVSGGHTSLYVGNLDASVTMNDLTQEFTKYGKVLATHVVFDRETKQSRCYGYVNYGTSEEADTALNGANFSSLKGRELRVMLQQPKFKSNNNIKGNLFVKNLPDAMDSKGLQDMFSTYGNILACKVSFNKMTNKTLNYGYVHFSDPAVAEKLLDDMNKEITGEGSIYVEEYKKPSNDTSAEWVSCYVSSFPKTWTKEDLTKVFENHGKVASAAVSFKSYDAEVIQGFVNFVNHEDAVKAVDALKEYVITLEDGETMKMYVNRHQTREERQRANQALIQQKKKEDIERTKGRFIYIGFGNEAMTVESLKALFTPFGAIDTCTIARDRNTHEPKPFGFVCMDSIENASRAIAALKSSPESKLKVELAQTREERSRQLKERRKMYGMAPYYSMPYSGIPMNRNPRKNNNRMSMPQNGMMPNMSSMPNMMPNMNGMMPNMGGMMPNMPNMGGMMPRGMMPNMSMQQNPNVYGYADAKITAIAQTMQTLPLITGEIISNLSDDDRRNTFGEHIFQLINSINDPRVSKITGMMLELPVEDLLLLVSNPQELYGKVCEANEVLDQSNPVN